MNTIESYNKVELKNPNNKPIVDEFIRYYKFIYSNYQNSEKTAKENYYKLLTIKKLIDIIVKFKEKIIYGSQLKDIKGIGTKTINRIDEILKTGKLSEIKEKENQINAIEELSKIYGIGPTKASFFYEKFGITNIKDLLKADNEKKIELTNQMKLGIKYKDLLITKIPRILIAKLDNIIHDLILKLDKDYISIACGSFRRGKDFSSDIDILISNKKLKNKKDCLIYLKKITDILSKDIIIDKLTINYTNHFQGFVSFNKIKDLPKDYDKKLFNVKKNVIRIDIIIVPIQYFYPALLHFTGSGDFNQKLRLHAKSLDMKLNEYGLEKKVNGKKVELKINSEADIFKELLLKYIPPEKRN
jgi:DNA polymerase/3'-5' exonuclease PolX